MNAVAAHCKETRHHPEWTNVYNKTSVRWTTHNPKGLSGKDVEAARFCDERGREMGEVELGEGEGEGVGGCCGK